MNDSKIKAIALGVVAIVTIGFLIWFGVHKKVASMPATTPTASTTQNTTPTPAVDSTQQKTSPKATAPVVTASLATPITDFKPRITKKFFGTYVTPQNSPVQPERFTGYHTGVDVEYGDVASDVPVVAVADGTITVARIASGYGGVMILQISWQGKNYSVLYGHIRPSSLPKVGAHVKQGDQLGVLGTAYSSETDGERRHLHFSIKPGTSTDIKGYVQNKSDLSGWIDPLSLYP